MEWTHGYHLKAWICYGRGNHHVFRECDRSQVEYTFEESSETVLHKICYLGMSKHIIYKFYYNVFKNTFDNMEILGQDTDSLIVQLNDNVSIVYEMCDMYKSFDFLELDNTNYF